MRYLVDECIGELIVRHLRIKGDDVLWVREIGGGAKDTQVLEWSVQQERVVLTEDFDYGDLVFAHGHRAIGVVILMLSSFGSAWEERASEVVERIARNERSFEGNICVLGRDRIKVRRLPV